MGKARHRLGKKKEPRRQEEGTRKASTKAIAAGAKMVVRSGISPVVPSRKCPGVFIRSGALAENPNCQMEVAAPVTLSRKGKSTTMPLASASLAKYTAMSGLRAVPRPQYR